MSFILKNINFRYQDLSPFAFQNLNLTLPSSGLTAIMGLNGSGKSTLLQLLSGALKPQSGNIFLDDKPLESYSGIKRAQKLAYVPQDFPAVFPYTVYEFVAFGLFPWRTGYTETCAQKDEIKAVLNRLDLTTLSTKKITQISGGERQRVLLAKALIQKTKILILDEPLNHLDLKQRLSFLKDLKPLAHEDGKQIVAVMHSLSEVRHYFESVVILKDQKVAAQGRVSEILKPELLSLIFDVPKTDLHL